MPDAEGNAFDGEVTAVSNEDADRALAKKTAAVEFEARMVADAEHAVTVAEAKIDAARGEVDAATDALASAAAGLADAQVRHAAAVADLGDT